MITPEEERRIIEKAKEEILLALPEVWSALLVDIKGQMGLNEKFYKDHPEFKGHEAAVRAVVDMVDGKNPMMTLDQKLSLAVPKIKDMISQTKGLNMDVSNSPDLSFKPIDSPSMGNGDL